MLYQVEWAEVLAPTPLLLNPSASSAEEVAAAVKVAQKR
jgi:hypothetical protein